jgi:hypothetical protein
MNKKQYLRFSLFIYLFMSVFFSYAQTYDYMGAFEMSSKLNNGVEQCIIHDSLGNVYQCGKVVQKYSAIKTLVWKAVATVNAQSPGKYQFNSMCVDKAGNAYVTGSFADSIKLGTFLIKSKGSFDVFIVKINNKGEFVWVKSYGAQGKDLGNSITIDKNGSLLIGGSFYGTLTLGNYTCKSKGMEDVFLAKMDTTGTFLWMKSYGDKHTDELQSIVCDNNNNLFIAGTFMYSTLYDSFALSGYGGRDIFVSKLNNSGDVQWIKNYGGTQQDEVSSLKLNKRKNALIMGGYVTNNAIFDTLVLKSYGNEDGFFACMDTTGKVTTIKNIGGLKTDFITGIDSDSLNNYYIVGNFIGSCSIFGASYTSMVGTDGFIAKLDSTFLLKRISIIKSVCFDYANTITTLNDGTTYFTCNLGCAGTINGQPAPDDNIIEKVASNLQYTWDVQMYLFSQGGAEEMQTVSSDSKNNKYCAGTFGNGASAGLKQIFSTVQTDGYNTFYAKYDRNNYPEWIHALGGNGYQTASDFIANKNYLYLLVTSTGNSISIEDTVFKTKGMCAVLAKLDTTGKCIWKKAIFGGAKDFGANALRIDANENVFVTGNFKDSLTIGSTVIRTPAFRKDFFIAKYDTNGQLIWVKNDGFNTFSNDIDLDSQGNAYIIGSSFGGSINSQSLAHYGYTDVFIAKYSAAGNFIRSKVYGSSTTDDGKTIRITNNDEIYISGGFTTDMVFENDSLKVPISGQPSFVCRLDSAFKINWVKALSTYVIIRDSEVDNPGNLYLCGTIINGLKIDNNQVIPTSVSNEVLIKISKNGAFMFYKVADKGSQGNAYKCSYNKETYRVVSTGILNGEGDHLIKLGSFSFTVDGYTSYVFEIYDSAKTVVNVPLLFSESNSTAFIFPNPFTSQTTIVFNKEQQSSLLRIVDVLGKEVRTIHFSGREFVIEKEELKSGIYFVQVVSQKKIIFNEKIVIQ